MTLPGIVLLVGGLLVVALALWWLLHVTEGAYLGPRVVAGLYDLHAERYNGIKDFVPHEDRIDLAAPLVERLLERGRAGPDAQVLDVATGTGRLPLALLEVPFYRGHVVGVDLSRRMLRVAERSLRRADLGERATLLHHPAAPLPFERASFDAATLLEALEFLPDRDAALRDLHRVLRPGAPLLVTRRTGWEARLFPGRTESATALEDRLERLGFTDVSTRRWTTLYDLVWARKDGG